MPQASQGIAVEPNGQTVVVAITEQGGGTPTVYTDRTAQTTIAMPATITSRTVFYLTDPTTFTVSAKVGGVENANRNAGTLTVDLSGGGFASLSVPVPVNTAATDKGTYAATATPNTFVGTQTIKQGFLTLDRSTEGNGVAPEMHFLGANGQWLAGIDVANAATSRDFVPVAIINAYSFLDGATTSGSPTLTSASQGGFASAIVGAALSGPGIPIGATVLSVQSATSLTMSANATATTSSISVFVNYPGVGDIVYVRHRGGLTPTIGFGVTPPDGTARVQIAGQAAEPTLGCLRLLQTAGQTGDMLTTLDSGNARRLWIDNAFVVNGNNNTYGSAFVVQGDATNNRTVSMIDNTKASHWAWSYTGATYLSLRSVTGAFNIITVDSSKNIQLGAAGGGMGFYGAGAVAKYTVTGSKGANAALTSLMTALAGLGLVTDSTT